MTDSDTNVNESNVTELPKVKYDLDGIDQFLQTVFHTELDEDEHVLAFMSKTNTPSYPTTEDDLLKRVGRTDYPLACYYSIATAVPDDKNRLRNRKSLFKRMHVVVLDDIGTKIKQADLPEGMWDNATYRIESSPGNYQLGFVLNEPVADLEHARLLIALMFSSGYSDTGGALCNKVVRLPCGVNGKKGDHQYFPVRLDHLNAEARFDPDDLLSLVGSKARWHDVQADADRARKMYLSRTEGATAWSPITSNGSTFDGIVDPVLEWLYEKDRVISEGIEFVQVKCPWAHEHTDNQFTASYSPLGWGPVPYTTMRSFNCFHDHCSHRTTEDFLIDVALENGPHVPRIEEVGDMTARYVFDQTGDCAWDMYATNPKPIKMSAFGTLHAGKVFRASLSTGKLHALPRKQLWIEAPNRVNVQGATYYPGCRERIIERGEDLYYNIYTLPERERRDPRMEHVQRFLEFIEYLIPHEDERLYFIEWLACKVQYPEFRGPGVIMYAPIEGTGRNTLLKIIGKLFGDFNIQRVSLSSVLAEGGFNEWQERQVVCIDETLALDNAIARGSAYDRLKEVVDSSPQPVEINPKYGHKRESITVASYLFFTNHSDGLQFPDDSRRFFVIANPDQRNTPEYYGRLIEWITDDEAIDWSTDLWNWFMQVPTDRDKMSNAPPLTKTAEQMIEDAKSPVEVIAEAFVDFFPNGWVVRRELDNLLRSVGDFQDRRIKGHMRRAYKRLVGPSHHSVVAKINGETVRFTPVDDDANEAELEETKLWYKNSYNHNDLIAFVKNRLEEHDILL